MEIHPFHGRSFRHVNDTDIRPVRRNRKRIEAEGGEGSGRAENKVAKAERW